MNFFNEALDGMISALDSRFNENTLPLLKPIGSLMHRNLSEIDDLLILASYFEKDLDLDELAEEYKIFCRAQSITGAVSKGQSDIH